MRDVKKENQIISLVLYFGGLILLLEWIYPLAQVTDTGHTSAFFLYIILCFILSASYLPWWIVSPLKFLGMLFVLHQIFFNEPFLSREWFAQLFADIQVNLSAVFSQDWFQLSSSFRTFLFLILLWMMSYLLYYWFAVRKKPFSFTLFTFIYLTVLDTFTTFDATNAILRAFVIGVALLGIAHLQHMVEKEKLRTPPMKTLVKWVAPLLVVIGFSTVIGYAAPKYDPIWPDPVPFLQSAAENGIGGEGPGGSVQKIGYGENDQRLGGGFVMDDTTVFYAQAPKSQYWKVETKDTYTGKGWVRSDEGEFTNSSGDVHGLQEYRDIVELNEDQAHIQFEEPGLLNKLVYMYGTEQILSNQDNMTVNYNTATGEVFSIVDDENRLPDEYQLEVLRPFYPINEMRKITGGQNQDHLADYLQLPDTLPDRVVNLAEEVVADEDNRYDKAKAIEDYFTREGFRYETQDVPVPDDDEDYVDQFLFESQVGYCDNFSTSMVVMLRAIDIPARWVKGFTGGERVVGEDMFEGSQPEYEIQNNNAHSWVEVYFPNVGWVPFEPTVGFSNPSNFVSGEDINDILEREQDYQTPEPTEQPDLQEEDSDDSEDEEENQAGAFFSLSNPTKYLLIGVAVVLLGLIFWLVMKKRYAILGKWKKKQMAHNRDVATFTDGYQFILKLLANQGLALEEGQTLNEYAQKVDRWYGHSDMSALTRYYERTVYRDEPLDRNHHEIYRLWNRVVENLLG
ncbi:transglutaminase TgpA family protein [Tenuibacillus multivorans]|uniref:Transglutaminase-like domain-containing protein n=1 Tax=Tenuibacillus multivorans TaxID=237069 RepID=A0A1H0E2U4_9BACI|nr:transglutaminaseTgpA domain-containing protein [Tenuibacillus multivorans]GEL76679.1 hypothetical protein TMU01_09140 [Tenuibacillus multivorans]SDN76618.1 protein of unknown function [Tenuibacillus multivorans]